MQPPRMRRRYADYFHDPEPLRVYPGRGTVYVRPFPDGTWLAVWAGDESNDDPEPDTEMFAGDREATMAWARSRPAAQFWIKPEVAAEWRPFAPDRPV